MCHPGSMSVQCTPLLCEAQDPPLQCSGAGFVAITRPLGNNSCCLETLCGEPCASPARRGGVLQGWGGPQGLGWAEAGPSGVPWYGKGSQ